MGVDAAAAAAMLVLLCGFGVVLCANSSGGVCDSWIVVDKKKCCGALTLIFEIVFSCELDVFFLR